MHTRSWRWLIVLSLTSCDASTAKGGDADKARAVTKAPAQAVADAPLATTPEPAPKPADAVEDASKPKGPPKADKQALADTRAQLLQQLNDGRAKVKAGDFAGGIAEFEAVLAIDPHHGAALGELGWAEFKAEELTRAHAHTLRAVSLARDDKTRGMLLYNLGRVAEARAQPAVALSHYELSLTLRANKTVKARAAALKQQLAASGEAPADASAPADAGKTPGLSVMKAGFTSMDTMCAHLKAESMCYSETCEQVAPVSTAPDVVMLAIGEGLMNCWHPALRSDGVWTLFNVALLGQHGTEVDQDIDSLTSRQHSTPDGPVVVYEYKAHLYERNWDRADEAAMDELPGDDAADSEGIVICDARRVACSNRLIHAYSFETGDGARSMMFKATYAFEGDTLKVSHVKARGDVLSHRPDDYYDGEQLMSVGDHRLADLIKRSP